MPTTLNLKPYLIQYENGQTRFILPPRSRHFTALLIGTFFLTIAAAILVLFAAILCFLPQLLLSHLPLTLWAAGIFLALLKAASLYLFPGYAQIFLARYELVTAHNGRGKNDTTAIDYRDLARLEIEAPSSLRSRLLLHYPTLSAELPTGERFVVVANYPREILQSLASDLQPLIESVRSRLPPDSDAPDLPSQGPIDIVDVSSIPVHQRDVLAPPLFCSVTRATTGDLSTFYIPHRGFFYSATSVVFFSLLMLALDALPTWLIISLLQTNPINRPNGSGFVIALAGCIIPFPLVFSLLALHLHSRKTIIIADPNPSADPALVWTTKGIFTSRQRHWPCNQLLAISTDTRATGTSFRLQTSTETPPLRLILLDSCRRKITLADGPDLEMRYLATQLRNLLHLSRS